MLLRRCTQGLCIIGFILLSGAIILDDMPLLLAGGTLIAGILGQYLVFDHQIRAVVSSAEVRRSVSRNPVRRGMVLQVTTRFTFRGTPRMHVQISDLLPPNTLIADGTTTITTRPDPTAQEHLCSYRIIPLIHGTLNFSGISVTVRNLFFEDTIRMTRESDQKPDITVQPSALFAVPSSESSEGTRDNRKASIWSSIDIHSLREYITGDDLRHVDWKISAKHDKLFIRKYTQPTNFPPLIIVDLPWCGTPCPEKEFERMVSEVTGLVKHTIQTYQYVSVLFISGPNILHLIREERNMSRCIMELREWMHPSERQVHFYRMADRSDLRSRVRNAEHALEQTTDNPTQAFCALLHNRYISILQYQRTPAFSGQVARTVSQLRMTQAYLFSLGCGDTSHIRHVVRPLKTQMIRVHIRMIEATHPEKPATSEEPADAAGVLP